MLYFLVCVCVCVYFCLLLILWVFEPLGPRELTGAVDLISHFKLLPHYEFFCKRSLPVSIADTHYLHNVVGDTEIRKGDGMQLDQLIQNTSFRDTNARIQPFDLDVLKEAFQLRETAPIDLPAVRNFLWFWSYLICFSCRNHLTCYHFFLLKISWMCFFFTYMNAAYSLFFSSLIGRERDSNYCRKIKKWE